MSKNKDNEENRLDWLELQLKEVDKQVQERYNQYAPDDEVTELKNKRAYYKDEINRIESKLKGYL